ncbi:hypothetical protein A6770_28275 [Nostoc minutum NIES-26]|uniref:Competence protein CoiA-like N-terminal domain-containing protein n=1 Tax=Nostoc minutum NIES-26 TaxID=1844469 RepID=A0A367QJM1_9NOSO|nr:hypothetical protein A6770_28275 [Nostoc minutum NIES-26]
MWLKYGVDKDGLLVCIEDIPSGKTLLNCPYCQVNLIAKKGKVKEHHFSHEEQTCHPVAKRDFPNLPLYDNFNIQLSAKGLKQLKLLWHEYGAKNYPISFDLIPSELIKAGMLRKNVYLRPPGYEFSEQGKIPVGTLELPLFNEVQEPLLLKKLQKLELAFEQARYKNATDLTYRHIDLKLYRAQLKRILSCTLYFLEVKTDKENLYKIGVTARPITQRVAEIEIDLMVHYKSVAIKVLGAWPHQGNVELYFKHRFHGFNYPIGSLTEYFKFNALDAKAILIELQQMLSKTLSDVEIDILEDNSNCLQVAV